MDNPSGSDLLSDLPLDIIEKILTFLPIRDAIRTSILSSKWRYRWVGLPRLDFDERGMGFPAGDEVIHEDPHLKNFVTQTLFRHQGPIHEFGLYVTVMGSCPNTDEWLLFLSRKGVKKLTLGISNWWREVFCLPSCLYSCQNLTYLNLYGCRFSPPPPTFKGFLCLRSLSLLHVDVPAATIESLVANCPILENIHCYDTEHSKLRISAPNLKYAVVHGNYKEIYLYAPLLAKLCLALELEDVVEELPLTHSVCNYTKFFGGLTNLDTLTGYFTKYLSIGIEHCHHPLALHHLEFIKLVDVNFDAMNEIMLVVRLITDATNLRCLEIQSSSGKEGASKTSHKQFWDSECPKDYTFRKLKTVEMTMFTGTRNEMQFVQFLRRSSPVLEVFTIVPVQTSEQEILDLSAELLCCKNDEIQFETIR